MSIFRKRSRAPINPEGSAQEDLFAEPSMDRLSRAGSNLPPPTALQVGAYLRQVREQQGLSIGEMYRRTRIRDVYLLALEAGEVEKLPGSTFVAGFLRLYAESLELTDRDFIERYLEGSGHEDALHTEPFSAPETLRHRPSPLVVLSGILLLLLLFFVYENHFSNLAVTARSPELPSITPRRAEHPPAARGTGERDTTEPLLDAEPEPEKGDLVSTLLARLFDRPARNDGAEMASPPPKSTAQHAGGVAKRSSPPTGPASGVVPPTPAVPPVVEEEPVHEEPQGPSSLAAAWLQKGKAWFAQMGQPTPPQEGEEARTPVMPPSSPQSRSVSVKLTPAAPTGQGNETSAANRGSTPSDKKATAASDKVAAAGSTGKNLPAEPAGQAAQPKPPGKP
ncbi:MAG: helix-turn-helix domain-containing protein, partial [Magnetococcales bacterium]|nr:helix-turn-helix domain-containing protein [Magnetococcales bacterium]